MAAVGRFDPLDRAQASPRSRRPQRSSGDLPHLPDPSAKLGIAASEALSEFMFPTWRRLNNGIDLYQINLQD
jgi:hypothetical protein